MMQEYIEKKMQGLDTNPFWKVIFEHLTPEVKGYVEHFLRTAMEEAVAKTREEMVEKLRKLQSEELERAKLGHATFYNAAIVDVLDFLSANSTPQ